MNHSWIAATSTVACWPTDEFGPAINTCRSRALSVCAKASMARWRGSRPRGLSALRLGRLCDL